MKIALQRTSDFDLETYRIGRNTVTIFKSKIFYKNRRIVPIKSDEILRAICIREKRILYTFEA